MSKDLEYSLVKDSRGRHFVIASERVSALAELFEGELEVISTHRGSDLLHLKYRSPLSANFKPVIAASHVTASTGTGLVHTAPAHGVEDWEAWRTINAGNIECAVDSHGRFSSKLTDFVHTSVAERLVGKEVLGQGNQEVIELITDTSALMREVSITHKYPYDWRTKKPVIYRSSQQWFANLDRIKDAALKAIDNVTFVPERGPACLLPRARCGADERNRPRHAQNVRRRQIRVVHLASARLGRADSCRLFGRRRWRARRALAYFDEHRSCHQRT